MNRSDFEGRPLLVSALALLSGVIAVVHWEGLVCLALLLFLLRRKLSLLVWIAGSFLVGLLISPSHNSAKTHIHGHVKGVGEVVSQPVLYGSHSSCEFRIYGASVTLSVDRNDIAYGQRLYVDGNLLPLHGERGERLSLQGDVGTLSCHASKVQILASGPLWFEWAVSLRNSFQGAIHKAIVGPEGSIDESMVLGLSGDIGNQVNRDLTRSGVAHLLSVSGVQIFLLAFLLQIGFARFPIDRKWQLVAAAVILALYATGSGLHLAALRAVIVALLSLFAYQARREPDYLSALSVAAIVSVLIQPWSVYTPSFQLSFVIVLALGLTWKPFWAQQSKKMIDRIAGKVWYLLRTSFIVSLVAAPLMAFHYGEVPIFSPIATLLVAPVVPILIVATMGAWAFSFLVASVQVGLLNFIAAPLAGWILLCADLLGGSPYSVIAFPPFSGYWLVAFYGALGLIYQGRPGRR